MAVHYYEKLIQEDLNVGVDVGQKRNPAGGTLVATQVGIHTLALGQAAALTTWLPAILSPLAVATTTISVSGAAIGDMVLASIDVTLAGALLFASVTAVNTVTLTLFNPTSSTVNVANGAAFNVRVLVLKTR